MKRINLDPYEAKILESFEKGEWVSKKLNAKSRGRLVDIARTTLKKDRTITIRLSRQDLNGIRSKAADEGIPYQTLISSLIHKFISGRIQTA